MKKPLISIIVPIYNGSNYVRETLESLANQTYSDFEVVIVDDGSTDDSLQICRDFAATNKRFKVIHQDNQGVSAARNAGVKEAAGDYIGFVDCDDLVSSHYIESLAQLLREGEADMSFVSHIRFGEGEPVFDDFNISSTTVCGNDEALISMLYADGLDVGPWGFLADRSICVAHPFPQGVQYEDLYAIPELCYSHKRIAVSVAKLYGYRIHKDSAMGAIEISEKRSIDYLVAIQRIIELYANDTRVGAAAKARVCLEALRLKLLLPLSACSHSVREAIGAEVRGIVRRTYRSVLADCKCPPSLKLKLILMNRAAGLIGPMKCLRVRLKGY